MGGSKRIGVQATTQDSQECEFFTLFPGVFLSTWLLVFSYTFLRSLLTCWLALFGAHLRHCQYSANRLRRNRCHGILPA